MRKFFLSICLLGFIAIASPSYGAPTEILLSCQKCHQKQYQQFSKSVHFNTIVDCTDCHGGLQDYQMRVDQALKYIKNPAAPEAIPNRPAFDHGKTFTGKASRAQVPEKCGQCHSNVELMNPYGLRTDQLARYKTSVHGKVLYTKKDDKVAVCIDCHGAHEVLPVSNPRSSVNPLNVPDTCGRCHDNSTLMSGYHISSLVVDQYKQSIHGQGLLKNRDVAMPNCATCHDYHGAQPPGFKDVGHVCGRCHQQTETYFKESVHAKLPNFRPCIGCHSPDPDSRNHKILAVTQSPDDLVKSYRTRWDQLADRGMSNTEIKETLRKSPPVLEEKQPIRLGTICQRCHGEMLQKGHRIFLKDLDREVKLHGPAMDKIMHDAETQYVETRARVERLSRGILIVQNEAFSLGPARTELISLWAVQHTLDENKIRSTAKKVTDICGQVQASLDEKEKRLQWRYISLIPLWGFLGVFIIAMRAKHKQLYKKWVVR